ncbi:hypothetical protein J1N35_038276, partial [Gossypium stocksii]
TKATVEGVATPVSLCYDIENHQAKIVPIVKDVVTLKPDRVKNIARIILCPTPTQVNSCTPRTFLSNFRVVNLVVLKTHLMPNKEEPPLSSF